MSQATVLAQIKVILEGVSGIGVVYDYERRSRSPAGYLELMRSGGIVNGCEITRTETQTDRDTAPTLKRAHTFNISGIYDVDDEAGSEKTFQALAEAVFAAFKSNITINNTCIDSEPLQVMIYTAPVDPAIPTEYHQADCTLVCYERDTYT